MPTRLQAEWRCSVATDSNPNPDDDGLPDVWGTANSRRFRRRAAKEQAERAEAEANRGTWRGLLWQAVGLVALTAAVGWWAGWWR